MNLRSGYATFMTIWAGQFLSRIGTALTRFALLIWAYQQTESALAVALLGFFGFLPTIVVGPFAGVWVDRLDRRKVMLLSDLFAGLATAGLLVLHLHDALQVWHLHLAALLAGTFDAFQSPAYMASVTVLLPKEQYGRASGLRSLAENGAQVFSPVLAGLLLAWVGIAGVMVVDLVTFGVAVGTLLVVRIPAVAVEPSEGTFWREMQVGFRYIWARPGLAGLTWMFMAMNFIAALTYFSTLPALILARSGNDELALATVQAAIGIAGVVGAVAVSVWGGPRRKIHGVFAGAGLSFLLGDLTLALGQSLPIWVAGALIGAVFMPLIGASNDAIWQAKVKPALQGRVFAAKAMWGQFLAPLGYLLGGLLADRWLEPAMLPGGSLADTFGWLVGIGPGTGIALLFVATSLVGGLASFAAYLIPAVRSVEDDLPDYEVAPGMPVAQPAWGD